MAKKNQTNQRKNYQEKNRDYYRNWPWPEGFLTPEEISPERAPSEESMDNIVKLNSERMLPTRYHKARARFGRDNVPVGLDCLYGMIPLNNYAVDEKNGLGGYIMIVTREMGMSKNTVEKVYGVRKMKDPLISGMCQVRSKCFTEGSSRVKPKEKGKEERVLGIKNPTDFRYHINGIEDGILKVTENLGDDQTRELNYDLSKI